MPHTVLFLCTGNSARSIMAEVLLNALGGGRFRAYSAGSHPKSRVHPLTLETLARQGYEVSGLRSKGWVEFTGARAPQVDFVITLCDEAAGESCPAFTGKAVRAHWSTPDPAGVSGSADAQRAAFRDALSEIRRRVQRFTSLPFESIDARAIQPLVDRIPFEPA